MKWVGSWCMCGSNGLQVEDRALHVTRPSLLIDAIPARAKQHMCGSHAVMIAIKNFFFIILSIPCINVLYVPSQKCIKICIYDFKLLINLIYFFYFIYINVDKWSLRTIVDYSTFHLVENKLLFFLTLTGDKI